MSTFWTPAATITPRELNIDEAAAVEDVLDAGSEWDAGRLPLDVAIAQGGGMSPHRARGLAFRFARNDDRIPALERLSEAMSRARGMVFLPNGGMMQSHVKNQNDWHIEQARRNGALER